MIKSFAEMITAEMIETCDVEAAAEVAEDNVVNGWENATRAEVAGACAQLMVTTERQIEDRAEEVKEDLLASMEAKLNRIAVMLRDEGGMDVTDIESVHQDMMDHIKRAAEERASLKSAVTRLQWEHRELRGVLESRTDIFHSSIDAMRQEISAMRAGLSFAASHFTPGREEVHRKVKQDTPCRAR
ncbi:hypothetical protein ACFY0N_30875 [Streptomyces vinaceus]|uniref:hypothetical protein n=1 Tax=Streptomyces vinaceus TaxID=1960 RepID=UPI0036B62F42